MKRVFSCGVALCLLLALPITADIFFGSPAMKSAISINPERPMPTAILGSKPAMAATAETKFKEPALPAGVIAIAPSTMNWEDANAFCRQKGGRLPLIGGVTKWDFYNPSHKNIPIDAFGAHGAPWPSGLPRKEFWTGTVPTFNPDLAWGVYEYSGAHFTASGGVRQEHGKFHVLCVPPLTAHETEEMHKAEEAATVRRDEKARKAYAELTVSGLFVAVSETAMNWNDAKAFCQQKGGRLPLIDGSDKETGLASDVPIEFFGTRGKPWPSNVPIGAYWSGTEDAEFPSSRVINEFNGNIDSPPAKPDSLYRVACLPAQETTMPATADGQYDLAIMTATSVTTLMEPTSNLPYVPVGRFSEGRAPVASKGAHGENKKYGYIDATGAIVIPLEYDSASVFSEGLAVVGKGPEKGRRYSFVDTNGKTVIIPSGYDKVWNFSEGLAIVGKGHTNDPLHPKYYGFIDKSGNTVIQAEYTAVGRFSDGLAFVIKEDFYDTYDSRDSTSKVTYGYIDKDGKIAIPLDLVLPPFIAGFPWYDGTSGWEFSEGFAVVTEHQSPRYSNEGYIDKTGKIVIPGEYGDAMRFSEGLAAVRKNGKIGYIDKAGTVVVPFEYENSARWEYGIIYVSFFEGLAAVSKDGKMGYIDKAGNVAVPFEYDVWEEDEGGWIFNDDQADLGMRFSEGLAAVRKNGKMGYIDNIGTVVVPFVYDYVSPFSEGLAWVLQGSPWGSDADNKWGLLQMHGGPGGVTPFAPAP